MRTAHAAIVTFAIIAQPAISSPASTQAIGALERFGEYGKLFSYGRDEYYLLFRQSYASEDSAGYSGQVRIYRKYEGDAYEVKLKNFFVKCNEFNGGPFVTWLAPEEPDTSAGYQVTIANPNKVPSADKKESYNLYWAVCHAKFKRFS